MSRYGEILYSRIGLNAIRTALYNTYWIIIVIIKMCPGKGKRKKKRDFSLVTNDVDHFGLTCRLVVATSKQQRIVN